MGLQPILESCLREIDYGRWEGLTRSEVERDFEAEYAIWQEDPFTIAPQGGESGLNVLNRVLPVVRRIVETHRHRSVLVVSHKGTNRLLISSLLGFDMRSYRDRLDQSPAALEHSRLHERRCVRACGFSTISLTTKASRPGP